MKTKQKRREKKRRNMQWNLVRKAYQYAKNSFYSENAGPYRTEYIESYVRSFIETYFNRWPYNGYNTPHLRAFKEQ